MLNALANKDSFLNTESTLLTLKWWRVMLIFLFFILLTGCLVTRLFQLHTTHTDFLQAQGNARTVRVVDMPSFRGIVTDRRGIPLAISTPVHAAWINPQHFQPNKKQLTELAKILGYRKETLLAKAKNHPHRVFVYLKRGLSPRIALKIKQLNIPGLSLKREFRRFYPTGAQTAQLVGFTDIDDQGQSGLELAFEKSLKPIIGKKKVLEDRTGRWVQDVDYLQPPQSGEDITLSIDSRIQGFAYRELEKALVKYGAKSATLVMLDVHTAEVLAMVTAPSFNPNNRSECKGSATRNRAVTDLVEPGSTIKAFSIASALSTRRFTPDSQIDTSPGIYYLSGHPVKDLHNYGTLSLKDILSKSSNIGISKITLDAPAEHLIETFRHLGIGDSINTPFPGERRGLLPSPPKNPFIHATIAFGYGLSATPLQIVHAYATLASQGVMKPISLVKRQDPYPVPGEQVLAPDIAKATLNMLTEVILKGTGSRANIPGYKTAGKTGTTRVVGPHGYDPHRHMGLFVGVTPVDNPRLATIVVVEEPNEANYYGGLVAAPIYKSVVSKALHILNIPPDNAT